MLNEVIFLWIAIYLPGGGANPFAGGTRIVGSGQVGGRVGVCTMVRGVTSVDGGAAAAADGVAREDCDEYTDFILTSSLGWESLNSSSSLSKFIVLPSFIGKAILENEPYYVALDCQVFKLTGKGLY